MRAFPIQYLFSRVLTDSEGLPIAHITTDEQKLRYALNQHHGLAISLWGSVLGEIIQRMMSASALSSSELRRMVVGELVDGATAATVAMAYDDIARKDFEAALGRLLSRAERVIRQI